MTARTVLVGLGCSMLEIRLAAWRFPGLVHRLRRLGQPVLQRLGRYRSEVGERLYAAEVRYSRMGSTAMSIVFLGTSAAIPSTSRRNSSLVLKMDGKQWLFDAGESTQLRFQESDLVRLTAVEKIFITHMHGDHVFGLPAILCTLSMYLGDGVAPNRRAPLEIYGPPPLRRYLRDTFRYTGFVTHFPYVVYELWESPDPPQPEPGGDAVDSLEVLGRNIGWKEHELKNGTCSHYWDVVTDDLKARVKAAPIVHTVPCLGYVVQEREHPGTLDVAKVRPYIDENAEALKAERGPLFSPMSLCANLKRGERVRLPDGRVLDPNDCVSKPSKGRKVVILGDTCDPTPIQFIGHSPDILVHESTNAFLASDAPSKSCDTVRQIAISRGHSTPQMAGAFARRLSAKMLVLYHFSPRYKGDESEESTAVMKQVRELAVAEFGRESVVTARDLMVITVARERDGDSRSHIESKSQRGD